MGPACPIFLYRNNLKASAVSLGVSSFVLGMAGVVVSYSGGNETLYRVVSILFLFSQVGSAYLALGMCGAALFLSLSHLSFASLVLTIGPFLGHLSGVRDIWGQVSLSLVGLAYVVISRQQCSKGFVGPK